MNMPPVTKNLIIINILVYFAMIVGERYGYHLNDWLGLHFVLANGFAPYQFFTYMFAHANWQHIFFNMFAVWMFGRVMESVWGPKRFLIYYVVCGLGAGVVQELAQFGEFFSHDWKLDGLVRTHWGVVTVAEALNTWNTVGASGAVYGILLAFGMTFPNERMFIFPLPVPIKAKYFVIGYAAIELFTGLQSSNDGIAHFAHLGGMLIGLLLILHWRKHNGDGGYYGKGGRSAGGRMRDFFRQFTSPRKPRMDVYRGGVRRDDYSYNADRKKREAEVDRILDKVKRSGYASLTEDEKRTLFDASQR